MPEERHAWPSDLRARYARVRAWEAAADRILDAEAARTLAGVLETAAAGAPAVEAALFRFEQALLRWDGQRVPDPAACASFPEAAFWGAHALAAQGDDQDSRDVMERLVAGVDAGGVVRVEEALLAIRATDHAWARMVRDIRDRTPVEWVVPGTGRAVRDPVGSYGQAVRRVWDLAADDAARLLRVAQATGPEAAEALTRRIRSAGPDPAPGDFVWVCEGLAQTPWREAQAAWTGRPGLTPEERAILDQILGRAPLPAVPDDIPVGRLRDIRR